MADNYGLRNRCLSWARFMGCGLLLLLLLCLAVVSLALGFGISSADAGRMRSFAAAVGTWETNPDFRRVGDDYVRLSCTAMQVRVAGFTATEVLMGLRSLPLVPKDFAVSPTSRKHYDDFAHGELSAYLHLCGEQGVGDARGMVEDLGRRKDLSDDHARAFLASFKLPAPIARDDGAIRGVRRLLADADAGRPFAFRQKVEEPLALRATEVARRLGFPPELSDMTPAQETVVWSQLDADAKAIDTELWRTKQVSDFLNGIWGQGYGHIYRALIESMLWSRVIGKVTGPLCLILCFLLVKPRRGQPPTFGRGGTGARTANRVAQPARDPAEAQEPANVPADVEA